MPVYWLLAIWVLEAESGNAGGELMQDFRKLEVWQKAHRLVLAVYRATQSLPREETFGVTMQARRSATAIATKIAEASGRDDNVSKAAEFRKAAASTNELEYLILLATDLAYLKQELSEELTAQVVEVRKMLFGLLRTL